MYYLVVDHQAKYAANKPNKPNAIDAQIVTHWKVLTKYDGLKKRTRNATVAATIRGNKPLATSSGKYLSLYSVPPS